MRPGGVAKFEQGMLCHLYQRLQHTCQAALQQCFASCKYKAKLLQATVTWANRWGKVWEGYVILLVSVSAICLPNSLGALLGFLQEKQSCFKQEWVRSRVRGKVWEGSVICVSVAAAHLLGWHRFQTKTSKAASSNSESERGLLHCLY